MHWVWVLEREDVKPVLVPQVAAHPLNTKVVCHLCKDIQISILLAFKFTYLYPGNPLSCTLLSSVSLVDHFSGNVLQTFWELLCMYACMHAIH